MTQTLKRKERFKVLDRMWEAFKDVPDEEVEREVSKAIKEVRVERRSTSANKNIASPALDT